MCVEVFRFVVGGGVPAAFEVVDPKIWPPFAVIVATVGLDPSTKMMDWAAR